MFFAQRDRYTLGRRSTDREMKGYGMFCSIFFRGDELYSSVVVFNPVAADQHMTKITWTTSLGLRAQG